MKPEPSQAMRLLINQIRQQTPFELPAARLCQGPCQGCPKKLLEYLDYQLEDHETALGRGLRPSLGDIQRLAKTATRIHRVLRNNNLL